jgi:large subunit ribosomal protein L1
MRFRSRRYKTDLDRQPKKPIPLDEAIRTVKGYSQAKFDQTVALVCHLGIDPKQADQMVRGSLSLPKGIGKSKRVIAFCGENDVEAAKQAGATEAGAEELIERIQKGWMDFDVAVAHPSLMGKVGKLGRILGPQGKMPSPKSGTVAPDVVTAVREYSAGKIEFRNDAGGNIHTVVGRLSFSDQDLKENITAFVGHLRRLKPATAKGQYLKRVSISGTMTPSVTIDVSSAGGLE